MQETQEMSVCVCVCVCVHVHTWVHCKGPLSVLMLKTGLHWEGEALTLEIQRTCHPLIQWNPSASGRRQH